MAHIQKTNCPKCGGEDWRLASIVYSEGLTHTSSTSLSGGILLPHLEDGVVGVGATSTNGVSQSSLSQLAAPPEKVAPPKKIESAKFARSARSGFTLSAVTILSAILFGEVNINENPILMFIAIPLPALLGLIFFIKAFVHHFDPEVRKRYDEALRKHEAEHQAALHRYQHTKMCLRCGIFFDDRGIIGQRACSNG